jgi:hypothetical protein
MSTEKKDNSPGSFAAVLASIRPKTDVELAEKLAKLIEEVKVTGKKGTLSITFEVKPVDGGGQAVIVNDAIRLKMPERTREGSMAFIGEGNRLQRTDPSAMPLFDDDIKSAPDYDTRTGEIKEPKA